MANLNDTQKTEVTNLAKEAAQMFVEEFNEVLDPESTDWDGEAWADDRKKLSFELTDELYSEAWELYQGELVAETERLSE